MSKKPDLSGYKEVSERIQDFREAHPEGSLQSEVVPSPVDGFVIVKGYAFRTPDDPCPGTGLAWEPVPGKTPYTKDSELQNAETSAWGRAIIAVGASDASKVASANEVRNRSDDGAAMSGPQVEQVDLADVIRVKVAVFAKWSEEERKDHWIAHAKKVLEGKPKNASEVDKVVKSMADAYYEEHPPSEDEAVF